MTHCCSSRNSTRRFHREYAGDATSYESTRRGRTGFRALIFGPVIASARRDSLSDASSSRRLRGPKTPRGHGLLNSGLGFWNRADLCARSLTARPLRPIVERNTGPRPGAPAIESSPGWSSGRYGRDCHGPRRRNGKVPQARLEPTIAMDETRTSSRRLGGNARCHIGGVAPSRPLHRRLREDLRGWGPRRDRPFSSRSTSSAAARISGAGSATGTARPSAPFRDSAAI